MARHQPRRAISVSPPREDHVRHARPGPGRRATCWCCRSPPSPATEGEKDALLAAGPAAFCTTPRHDGHAIVLVRFGAADAGEMGEPPAGAWRLRAPGRPAAGFDGRARGTGLAGGERELPRTA
ncbi:hypothetical protein ACBJ59_06545 [Nonomuraea sp. MTCD27]|uniref:hypothetical protein n=1 Tax=Nonomuraea sp. MTCD27 TaxID=1676747 RepID=UPI0035C10710